MRKRRRVKQVTSLQARIADWATKLRKQTESMEPGPKRDELLEKLREAETAMNLQKWVSSHEL